MKKNIVRLLLLAFCLFFLCQSQDVSLNMAKYLNQENNTSATLFQHLFNLNIDIEQLHLFFIIIWSVFFLLLFNILSHSLNLFYSISICGLLLPAFLFQGVINTQVFDLFFILILIVGLLKRNRWSKKTQVALSLIFGFLWVLLSSSPFLAFTERTLNLTLVESLLNNNIMIWYHISLLFISFLLTISLDINKSSKWKSFLLLFSILTYALFFTSSSILFAISIIIPILLIKQQAVLNTLSKRLLIVSIYIFVPLGLSGLYNNSYNHNNWTLGFNESTQKVYDFTNRITFTGNVFNNKEAQLEANLFLKNATPFFKNTQEKGKQQQLFNTLIVNPSQWDQYSEEQNINIIYFSLVNQPQETLYFLGERLNTGNWAIIYEEKGEKVVLMKRSPENTNIINQFERFPSTNN